MIYSINKYFNIKFNEYIFNNSLIEFNGYYVMTYRHIVYNYNIKTHPWSAWFKSYNNVNKKIIDNNKELLVNIKLFSLDKYREIYDNDTFINMISNNNVIISDDENTQIDTTGLCIFEKNEDFNKIVMIYNNPFFFNNYNQDSRLYNINNELFITYNGFIKNNDDLCVKLLYRKIIINFKYDNIYIGEELPLINPKFNIERKVEKNCILDYNKNVIYDINGVFKYIDKNKGLICHNIINLMNIISYYGNNNIFFSLGTPIQQIKINNKIYNISLGHVKVNYKNIEKNTSFYKFLKNIDFTTIKMHGKYIYFMFFYVFDENYNITHISYSFIPTDNNNQHLPYLLVFPTGFYKSNNKYIISYGEGDEFSKILILSEKNILDLLIPINNIDINYKFLFYNVDTYKYIELYDVYTYLIYGYYSMFNCGDDAFKIAFNNYLKIKNKDKKYIINFLNPYNINNYYNNIYDEIIVGGGDVINSYFMDPIIKFNKNNDINMIAISIGIPYLDNLHYLNIFKKVYLRNSNDYLDIINNKYNDVIFDISKFNYIPDICFGLDIINEPINIIINKDKINIGIFLCRTFYNLKYENEYNNLILQISLLLNQILNINNNIYIYLIPFNINNNNNKENDCIINNHLKILNINNDRIINVEYKLFNKNLYVEQINTIISQLNFGICSRFHSHIFCINNNIPFLSLSCTRKVFELLNELNLFDIYCPLNCINDIPFNFDINKCLDIFKYLLNNNEDKKIFLKNIMINKKNDIFYNI